MESRRQLEHRLRRDQRERRDLSAFAALLAAPHDLGDGTDGLVLPARARLAISHEAGMSEGDVVVHIAGDGDLDFTHPELAADEVHRGNWGERGMTVTVENVGAPEGALTLYLIDPFGRPLPIATATLVEEA